MKELIRCKCEIDWGYSAVNFEMIKTIFSSIKAPLDDPLFFQEIFTAFSKIHKKILSKDADNIRRVCSEEYDEISQRLDKTKLQESCSVRNVLKTRRLANLLINDKGEILTSLLPKAIEHLKNYLYFLGPHRQYDSKRQEHILHVLNELNENKQLIRLLKAIGKPHAHPFADQIIRDTLQLPENTTITDAHARRASLAAWMCYLRQNVGSCFATAPAIIIHDEQFEQFLIDINEILSTGRLKRTYEGIEYSVPLSISWGGGDLRRMLFIPSGESIKLTEIWNSPGLIAAFEAGGLIELELSLKEKTERSKNLVLEYFRSASISQQPYIFISVEDLLKEIFMHHFEITSQDLIDYENRPKEMLQGSLIQTLPSGSRIGKGQACANFLNQIERAQNAFKALADNALLKCWEFTLASFSENKSGFTRWNLYSSLGLGMQEKGGIGFCLYEIIKKKLDEANQKVQEFQIEYEQVYSQIKYMESRIRHASEKEAQWLRAEYQSRRNEFFSLESIRDKLHRKATRLASLYNDLVRFYDHMFPLFFQEVYDADMHEVSSGPFDDSPAGFRLIYKHGRSNTSQWTRIRFPNEFIDALVNFFIVSEAELKSLEEFEGLESELGEIVTAVVGHIKTRDFLESAFYRIAIAHHARIVKDPLENLDKIEKKPWAYTSGGTMDTLISCYYRRDQKPTEVSRWVENPMELLVFLIDTAKQIPHQIMEYFLQDPKKSMLMQSPTHAFNFKPGTSPFKEGWQNDTFTYTWVRDELVRPLQQFIDRIYLEEDHMECLANCLKQIVPKEIRENFKKTFSNLYGRMKVSEFRDFVLSSFNKEKNLHTGRHSLLSADDVDSVLYTHLPLFSGYFLKERVTQIFQQLPELVQDNNLLSEMINMVVDSSMGIKIFSAKMLRNICSAILCLYSQNTSLPLDSHKLIAQASQKLGYSMPMPVIFADTNWMRDEFAFLVNPGTGKLELWRTDFIGSEGYPMSIWAQWLNGSRQDISWSVFVNPYEYTPAPPVTKLGGKR